MSKSKIIILFISIFFISLLVWIVSEIFENMKDNRKGVDDTKIPYHYNSISYDPKPIDVKEMLKKNKKYPEDSIIKNNPKNAEAYFDRGVKKYESNDLQEAKLDFDKAIELNPKYAEAYYYRAQSNLLTGIGVSMDLDEAIKLNPKYREAYKSRAIHKSYNDKKAACEDFKMAKDLGDTSCNYWINKYCN